MNNVTTFETAQRLKAAGFPQPVPEFGQVWYGKNSVYPDIKEYLIIIGADHGEQYEGGRINVVFSGGTCDDFTLSSFKKRFTYCPAATDILRELGEQFKVQRVITRIFYYKGPVYYINGESDFYDEADYFTEASLTEALAKKWLSLHEKTEQNAL